MLLAYTTGVFFSFPFFFLSYFFYWTGKGDRKNDFERTTHEQCGLSECKHLQDQRARPFLLPLPCWLNDRHILRSRLNDRHMVRSRDRCSRQLLEIVILTQGRARSCVQCSCQWVQLCITLQPLRVGMRA